jgi:hypothetical protein
MMFMIMLRLQQLAAPAATLELAPLWEMAKGLMLFLSTALLSWIAKTVAQVRTSQRDQLHILKGVDGDGGFKKDIAGLVSTVRSHDRRLRRIEGRFIGIDAVEDADEQDHPGADRRLSLRRTRDQILEGLATDTHPLPDEEADQ